MSKLVPKVCALAFVSILVVPTTTFAGDAFLKLGLIFDPDPGGFSDSWFVSVGSDWGFHPQGFWGLEFQGAYRSDTMGDVKIKQVPANVFVNFKWKSPGQGIRPYAGGGFGLISTYVRVSDFEGSDNDWLTDAGFQFMGGVEFSRKLAVELLGQKAFEDGSKWIYSFLFGLRW